MKVNILGKSRKGKKNFLLSSVTGYTITAIKNTNSKTVNATVDKFSGVTSIDWQFEGRSVKLSTFDYSLDFTIYDEVVIKEGTTLPTEIKTLGSLASNTDFVFGGVTFVKTASDMVFPDQPDDSLIICVIKGTTNSVAIADYTLVTIEL